jgi:predicted dehydrogenase
MAVALSTLNIGVIGYGLRGGLVHHAHSPDDGVAVVAAADVDREALARFEQIYGPDARTTEDWRELVRDDGIDALFVLSPDYLHEEHAVAALLAGKAVYLEKPMAITTEGCDRILAAAVESGSRLYVGHNMRHMAFTRKMKELIDRGAIGEVQTAWCRHFVSYGGDAYFKDWHAERAKANTLLLQKASHDIDILHWLCGGYATRVNAMGALKVYSRIGDRHAVDDPGDASWHETNWPPLSQKGLNPAIDVEDVSMFQAQLDNGVLIAYQQCHFAPDGWRNYCIIGTEGRIENIGEEKVCLWNHRKDGYWEGDETHDTPHEETGHGGADPRIVSEFIRYVREGGRTETSPIAARQSVATGCAAAMSLRHGCYPVDVPPLPAPIEDVLS